MVVGIRNTGIREYGNTVYSDIDMRYSVFGILFSVFGYSVLCPA
jgi:hypothetical protein